eukprot:Rhum_TRINITY_DN4372_c0_g1::Rhum_TRINITY_DN4372_c0_g1_i1::g.14070::m.14070
MMDVAGLGAAALLMLLFHAYYNCPFVKVVHILFCTREEAAVCLAGLRRDHQHTVASLLLAQTRAASNARAYVAQLDRMHLTTEKLHAAFARVDEEGRARILREVEDVMVREGQMSLTVELAATFNNPALQTQVQAAVDELGLDLTAFEALPRSEQVRKMAASAKGKAIIGEAAHSLDLKKEVKALARLKRRDFEVVDYGHLALAVAQEESYDYLDKPAQAKYLMKNKRFMKDYDAGSAAALDAAFAMLGKAQQEEVRAESAAYMKKLFVQAAARESMCESKRASTPGSVKGFLAMFNKRISAEVLEIDTRRLTVGNACAEPFETLHGWHIMYVDSLENCQKQQAIVLATLQRNREEAELLGKKYQ